MKTKVIEENVLELDKKLLKEIYCHVNKQMIYKYGSLVEVLKSRHHGYDIEDFAQETIELVINAFKNKLFTNLNQLKGFINSTMKFHYLKEKRKYFYTKQRGTATCISLNDTIFENKCIEDLIEDPKDFNDDSTFDLHHLQSKNLLIAFKNNDCHIIKSIELKNFSGFHIISVNHFINIQIKLGQKETCKYFKKKGLYMTKDLFEFISQKIIDYCKENNLLSISL